MDFIGHRGCNYKGFNQNTLRSFSHVIKQGCKAVEFDVQLTKDGELVVVHNLDLEKVSNGKGLVSQKSLMEISSLRAGSLEDGEDLIPVLSKVFDLFADYDGVVMHLELKGDNTGRETGQLIKKYIQEGKLALSAFLISSFNWDELRQIREILPGIPVALLDGSIRRKVLLEEIPGAKPLFEKIFAYGGEDYMLPLSSDLKSTENILFDHEPDAKVRSIVLDEVRKCLEGEYYNDNLINRALSFNAVSINLWYCTLHEDIVKKAHENGLKVFAYTVNTKQEADTLENLGVDGIFTDYYIDMV